LNCLPFVPIDSTYGESEVLARLRAGTPPKNPDLPIGTDQWMA